MICYKSVLGGGQRFHVLELQISHLRKIRKFRRSHARQLFGNVFRNVLLNLHLFSLVGFSPPNSLSKGVGEGVGSCQLAEVLCASETDIFESVNKTQ